MAATRTSVDTRLLRRVGRWLTAAGLDGATDDGTNVDLADPIAWAIGQTGGTVVDTLAPDDADLATVTSDDQMLDLAEYRLLLNAYQNYTKVDVEGLAGKAKLDQLRAGLKEAITLKRAQIASDYGIGVFAASESFSVAHQVAW